MSLLGLFSLAKELVQYDELQEKIEEGLGASLNVMDAAKPYLLAALWKQTGRSMLVITSRLEAARQLYDQTAFYTGDDPKVRLLPEPDYLPYGSMAPDRSTLQQRLATLGGLVAEEGTLVIAPAYAMAARTLSPKQLRESLITIERGARVSLMDLVRRWEALGYQSEPTVDLPGAMSRRGGIVDIYPFNTMQPVRIELFGDHVESIRFFNPTTQRSTDQIASITIGPAAEMLPAGAKKQVALEGLSPEAKTKLEADLLRLAAGERFEDMAFYAPLFNTATALDYALAGTVVVLDEPVGIRGALEELAMDADQLKKDLEEKHALPNNFPSPFMAWPDMEARTSKIARLVKFESIGVDLAGRASDEEEPLFSAPAAYRGRTKVLLADLLQMLQTGERVVVVTQQAPRLAELLKEAAVPFVQEQELNQTPPAQTLTLVHGSLAEGWTLPARRTVLLTDSELFGLAKQRRYMRRRPVRRQSFLAELSLGDYVVHIDHGVGQFAGTEVRQADGQEREYLVLEYASGDRLLVPADQIERVGPYVGSGDHPPSLTQLGTQEWTRAKDRAKASTAHVARELLAIYAAREIVPGQAFGPDTPWQKEMEGAFPYVETPDQMRTIDEVKADMERPKPMDRIVTGDVGYGKTEVALRAAFKAVMAGSQVAVLVPTTVLAQQHFNTFRDRLAPFPARVEMLSRFRSPKEQDQVVAGLSAGEVDICIGTHRLVQKDIRFKNLGLIIVDEEQRFGVSHKERLKEMRREVDVLSLSATPIPRTLYMALAGVRDMSVMETPPEDRLPVKTYVSEFDDRMVRDAIVREMERGGQVFFVHNRVYNIGIMAERINRLVPEAQVLVGHGQMPEEALERVMLAFSQGKADVLLCTTIIESGLDLPNVNTIIIDGADTMGLAQLHQLRGRVGRGANRAYAYLLYNKDRALTEISEKRLKTILSATELGAGFRIAMKDLEIRGAGNLLGTEQHGNMSAVGLDLYIRLLAAAVEELKAAQDSTYKKAPVEPPPPHIELPMPAHIPETYVTDLPTRLHLYQRMARIEDQSVVDQLAEELKDRFGPWPEPVENLLFMLKVKHMALKAGVLSISHQTGELILAGDENTWTGLLGVQRPYGDGVRIGNTRVRLDIKRLGNRWRSALSTLLAGAGRSPTRELARSR